MKQPGRPRPTPADPGREGPSASLPPTPAGAALATGVGGRMAPLPHLVARVDSFVGPSRGLCNWLLEWTRIGWFHDNYSVVERATRKAVGLNRLMESRFWGSLRLLVIFGALGFCYAYFEVVSGYQSWSLRCWARVATPD